MAFNEAAQAAYGIIYIFLSLAACRERDLHKGSLDVVGHEK